MRSDGKGHFFTCRLGVRNHWFPIRLRGVTVGIAYVQAPADAKAMSPRWRCRRRKLPGGADPRISSGAKSLSRAEFGRAARLLRFIVQHVQTSSLADLRQTDLTKARLALLELQTVATRLRGELNGLLPAFSKMAPGLEPESHTGRIVHAALEYICGNYGSPLTLQRCAEAVQLNPAYFSSLFAHAVGLPFKTYLTEVRVEKARELLRDPTRNVSEVAYAVGYASENRFRIAFKRVTGLSPTSWRDTLRMPLPTLLMWLLGETELIESLKLFFGL